MVIHKSKYIKCAGMCAGIFEKYNNTLFGFQQEYLNIGLYDKFNELYIKNVESFDQKYKCDYIRDPFMYFDIYKQFKKKGSSMTLADIEKMKESIVDFLRSVLYQIEEPQAHMWAGNFVCEILLHLSKIKRTTGNTNAID